MYYQEAKGFLKRQDLGRYLHIKGIQDTTATNNFEIILTHPWKFVNMEAQAAGPTTTEEDGTRTKQQHVDILLHSKKTRKRDGFLTTPKEQTELIKKIDSILLEEPLQLSSP